MTVESSLLVIRFQVEEGAWSDILRDESHLFYVDMSDAVVAVDAATGQESWKVSSGVSNDNLFVTSSPALVHGKVFRRNEWDGLRCRKRERTPRSRRAGVYPWTKWRQSVPDPSTRSRPAASANARKSRSRVRRGMPPSMQLWASSASPRRALRRFSPPRLLGLQTLVRPPPDGFPFLRRGEFTDRYVVSVRIPE